MNEKIKNERDFFLKNLKNSDNEKKKLFHYQSVLNLSIGLALLNNSASHNSSKELMLEYFNLMKQFDYLLSQKESLVYYKKYILPIGRHLIYNSGYRTKGDVFKYISVGLVFDIILYQFLTNIFYPIFIIIFSLIAYLKQKKQKQKNKFFSLHW